MSLVECDCELSIPPHRVTEKIQTKCKYCEKTIPYTVANSSTMKRHRTTTALNQQSLEKLWQSRLVLVGFMRTQSCLVFFFYFSGILSGNQEHAFCSGFQTAESWQLAHCLTPASVHTWHSPGAKEKAVLWFLASRMRWLLFIFANKLFVFVFYHIYKLTWKLNSKTAQFHYTISLLLLWH